MSLYGFVAIGFGVGILASVAKIKRNGSPMEIVFTSFCALVAMGMVLFMADCAMKTSCNLGPQATRAVLTAIIIPISFFTTIALPTTAGFFVSSLAIMIIRAITLRSN